MAKKIEETRKKNTITEKMISVKIEDYNRIVKIAGDEQRTIRSVVDRMITQYEKS